MISKITPPYFCRIITFLLYFSASYAQNIGINTDDPKSTLDVKAYRPEETATTNEGIITPILTKKRITNISNPVEGTLVYASDATYTPTNTRLRMRVAEITEKGYYFYNGTKWVKVAVTYGDSNSVALVNGTFERKALTGDVTAAQNDNSVTVSKIQGKAISTTEPTKNQVLKWNGRAWTPDTDTDTQYTAGAGMKLSRTQFYRTGLEQKDAEPGSSKGLTIIGRNDANYLNVGNYSTDLSYSDTPGNGVSGQYSFATGKNNKVTGSYSFVAGKNNTAYNDEGYVIGVNNTVKGGNVYQCVAIGRDNNISGGNGYNNFIMGEGNAIPAPNGHYNYIIGQSNTISGGNGFNNYVMGQSNTISAGNGSNNYVMGRGLLISRGNTSNQTIIGTYNQSISSFNAIFIIGNGKDNDNRSNTFLVQKDGTAKAKAFVTQSSGSIMPDYVFQKYYTGKSKLKDSYQFRTLAQVEAFIKKNGYLPGYLSAQEIQQQGEINLGETQLTNIEKIEELFLHTLEQEKKLQQQQQEIEQLKAEISELKKLILSSH